MSPLTDTDEVRRHEKFALDRALAGTTATQEVRDWCAVSGLYLGGTSANRRMAVLNVERGACSTQVGSLYDTR